MLDFSQFEEINGKLKALNEKLIVVGKGAKYGQIIFLAGGAGSGKGFAIGQFLDNSKFKVRDVDELKVAFLRVQELTGKYPEIKGLDLSRPKDVFKLHQFVKDKGIKDKTLDLMLGQAKEGRLPNVIFDVTLKDMDDINEVMPRLINLGYKPRDIHVVWVLTNYHIAMQQNKSRPRIVPDDIMLKTHEGAAHTMHRMLTGKVPNGLDGGIYVILGGAKHTIFHNDPQTGKPLDGRDGRIVVKDFKYLKMKDAGRKIISEPEVKKQVLDWIKGNIPKTKKTKEIFGSGRDKITEAKKTDLPIIFCDMDQVLCNFLKGTEEALGASYADKEYWAKDSSGDKKKELAKKAPNLFRNLEWMPDGKALYNFIKKHDMEILSAYPTWLKHGRNDKIKWLKSNTNISSSKINLVQRKDKRNYAEQDGKPAILIDDHIKNIREWEQAGGIGIHHTSTTKTLGKLKALGF